MPKPNDKPSDELSEADKKLLEEKRAEFKEKIRYLENKLHLKMKAVLVGSETAITAMLAIIPNPDFFEHHKKKIIVPGSRQDGKALKG